MSSTMSTQCVEWMLVNGTTETYKETEVGNLTKGSVFKDTILCLPMSVGTDEAKRQKQKH